MTQPDKNTHFEALLHYMRDNRGFDFSGYKRASLHRRILRRMQMLEIERFEDYMDYLEVHPDEFVQLFNTILINVTQFFRDPDTWELIDQEVIPKIIVRKQDDEPIRIWSAGVSSGEEAYTISILLAEHLGIEAFKQRVKIYGTDVDEDALSRARTARYSAKEVENIPSHLREKYFEPVNAEFIFHKELRRGVIFGRHELIHDAPISRVDVILCRNILMYFNSETQARVLNRLNFALNDGGFLVLGKAEMLLTHGHLFTPFHHKLRVFKKNVPSFLHTERTVPIHSPAAPSQMPSNTDQAAIRELVFESSVSPQLVIDLNGRLALANKNAHEMFGLSRHDIGRPFKDLRLSYQPVELRSYIDQAFNSLDPFLIKDVLWHSSDEPEQYFNVIVNGLVSYEKTPIAVSVIFQEVTQLKLLQLKLQETNHELETAMEELESTNEELVTTNEELQSTIEELETTNEELQSTNEELETMNEEMQSTNEELSQVNHEMVQRSEELNQLNNYLNSILSSIESGVVVLDKDYAVQLWNPKAEDLWGLRQEEVKGYNLFNLDIGLPVEQLHAPVRQVKNGDGMIEGLELAAVNRRGRKVTIEVTLTPIKDGDKGINGIVLIMDEKN
jgi:two-component system, chemotaxis family, CheB/CheR fusion protein